jgi:Uma2 family endonuclease
MWLTSCSITSLVPPRMIRRPPARTDPSAPRVACYVRDRVGAISKPFVTFAEYLEAELRRDAKHEWLDGAVYALHRGTPEHARLSARIARLLGNALPADCEVYSSDMMLYLAKAKLSTYADASVVCGPLETITVKRNRRSLGEAVTNPTVIVEVFSESTERYEREEKFGYYRTLPSLQEYVLISQDEPVIEVYWRPASIAPRRASFPLSPGSRDRWECERATAGGTVTIHGCTIEVTAVYNARD